MFWRSSGRHNMDERSSGLQEKSPLRLPGSKTCWEGLEDLQGVCFAQWSFSLAGGSELLEGLEAAGSPLSPGGSCRLPQAPLAGPGTGHGMGMGTVRVNHRCDQTARGGKTAIPKPARNSRPFPPTAENLFDKQHLKHVRKETVCLLECDFLGSRISP